MASRLPESQQKIKQTRAMDGEIARTIRARQAIRAVRLVNRRLPRWMHVGHSSVVPVSRRRDPT